MKPGLYNTFFPIMKVILPKSMGSSQLGDGKHWLQAGSGNLLYFQTVLEFKHG